MYTAVVSSQNNFKDPKATVLQYFGIYFRLGNLQPTNKTIEISSLTGGDSFHITSVRLLDI